MVIYSEQFSQDLEDLLYGLVTWEKHPLSFEHAQLLYVEDIINIVDTLDTKTFHKSAVYATHLRYGSKVFPYSRNKQTTWYIIYNLDLHGNVYVNKIISNHLTV